MYIKNYALLMRMRYDGAALAPQWCVAKGPDTYLGRSKKSVIQLGLPEKI
jgi:hypothetical protein